MSITLGVTLYSMTNEWLAGRYTLPELVDEVRGGDSARVSS